MLHLIDPVLLHIGPVEIRYYGLMYLVGIGVGLWSLSWMERHDTTFPLKKDEIFDFVFWIFMGVIVGARLGIVLFYNPAYYLAHPLEIFAVWQGGMSFHGGLLGVAIVTYFYTKYKNINPLLLADCLVIPFALALMFGRVGNFLNGELWGRVTELPLCFDYSQNPHLSNPPSGCRHASQLYEAAKNLLIFLLLIAAYRRFPARKPGTLAFLFLILYGTLRSLIEFTREPSWTYAGITAGQWLSLPLIVIGLTGLAYLYKNRSKKISTS